MPVPTYTVGYLISRTFDLLLGSTREEMNRLGEDIGAADTTFNIDFAPEGAQRGTYVCIDDEIMYVWSNTKASGNSSEIEVQRGMKGTQATTHSAKTLIFVNPYFTKYQVRQTLQDELRSWAPQVFQAKTIDIPKRDFIAGYDLAGIGPHFGVLNLLASPDNRYSPDDLDWASVPYRLIQSAPVSDFPSGDALIITSPGGVFDAPGSFHLEYAAPIDVDSTFNDGDFLESMGIDSSDIDIPPYGAAWRLASGREMRRMLFEGQGQSSDLQNVPPGYQLAAADKFKGDRDSRLQDAIQRIRAKYPTRRTT